MTSDFDGYKFACAVISSRHAIQKLVVGSNATDTIWRRIAIGQACVEEQLEQLYGL
jgi:hypothetical protein